MASQDLVTVDEFIEMMVNFQDMALMLLSAQRRLSIEIIQDQLVFVERMIEVIEDDIDTFSLEAVQEELPGNRWLDFYFDVIPLMELHLAFEQSELYYLS